MSSAVTSDGRKVHFCHKKTTSFWENLLMIVVLFLVNKDFTPEAWL